MFSRRHFIGQTIRAAMVISAGNLLQSFAPGTFELPDPSKVRLRFALASDGHYGQPKTEFEATHNTMVQWLNKEKENRGLDFTVVNGDLFHDDPAHFAPMHKTWSGLTMPWYVSHGNHDKIEEATWQSTFNYGWHHAFEVGNCGFIILNTADINGKYICPDLKFTAEQLKKFENKKHLFVFMHITPFKWTDNGIECPELTAMFAKQSNLRGIFHGHDHDQDGVKEDNGKHYFFDGHVGGSWGKPYYGYRIVEVLKNGEILTYQMNGAAAKQENSTTINR